MERDYLLDSKTYNLIKNVVTIVLPTFATLYAALSVVMNFVNPEVVVVASAVFAMFGGILLKISEKSWNKSNSKYDGELITTGNDADTGLPDLKLNLRASPEGFVDRKTIRLKSIDERQAS
jgi:hypothetical protein